MPFPLGRIVARAQPRTLAASNTISMRPLTLDAVSAFVVQMGFRIASSSSVPTSATGLSRMLTQYPLSTQVPLSSFCTESVMRHWSRCFGFLQDVA